MIAQKTCGDEDTSIHSYRASGVRRQRALLHFGCIPGSAGGITTLLVAILRTASSLHSRFEIPFLPDGMPY